MVTSITTIRTGYLLLDGGAMFGVVPKMVWSRMIQPDETNRCTWCMRVLLVTTPDRVILIDTGIGEKQDEKFKSFFGPTQQDLFLSELRQNGFTPEMVTDVLLTHLHFDHVGGAIMLDDYGKAVPTFPNARYWTNKSHYQAACTPNAREKASFLKENFVPLQEWGMLHFLDESPEFDWIPGISLRTVYGHTDAMYVPVLETSKRKVAYCADLIPSFHHFGMPYVMAYDIRPLETMKEKDALLRWALENDALLCFEHDPAIEACSVVQDDTGRIIPGKKGLFLDVM